MISEVRATRVISRQRSRPVPLSSLAKSSLVAVRHGFAFTLPRGWFGQPPFHVNIRSLLHKWLYVYERGCARYFKVPGSVLQVTRSRHYV